MIISIFNQKGGVAKTTTTINLAAGLAVKGKKVLVIDMDAQANATSGLKIKEEDVKETIFSLLSERKVSKERISEVIMKTPFERIDVIGADIELSDAEIVLSNAIAREHLLKKLLEVVKVDYDYIIIDCPPNLGLLSVNSLVASDRLIIPVAPSYFSIKGIKHLLNVFEMIKEGLNPDLEIMGVLITLFDVRKNISKDIRTDLINAFGDKVFNTTIRVNSQIEYSQDNQIPVIYFNNKCSGYDDYMSLTEEVLNYEWK